MSEDIFIGQSHQDVPETFFFPSVVLSLECPECGQTSTVILDVPLQIDVKALCGKCNTPFLLRPNARDTSRNELDVFAKLSRHAIKGPRDKPSPIDVRLVNLSRGGLAVIIQKAQMSGHTFHTGETLYFSFSLSEKGENQIIYLHGKIRRIQEDPNTGACKVGVAFDDPNAHEEKNPGFFYFG